LHQIANTGSIVDFRRKSWITLHMLGVNPVAQGQLSCPSSIFGVAVCICRGCAV